MRRAEARLPFDTRLNVLANCSDGRTAWGAHFNVLMTRAGYNGLLYRKPHWAGFFTTHLVTSVLYTGQGLVGAANRRPACSYQLSQRADWFERFTGQQTMYERPLINLRDEPHADSSLARLHIIYFDQVLAPTANILKAGTTQLVLAMIEDGWIDPALCLDDPLVAASEISRDLGMQQLYATSVRGRRMTAVELQQALANLAGEFVASGAADGIVPRAGEIVALWLETLEMLKRRDVEGLAAKCDAWLKYLLLERQRGAKNLSWSSDRLRVADLIYASLDPDVSLFYQAADTGFVERMPDDRTLGQCTFEPPDDTRAYFRAHALRRYGDAVSSMDWSRITFRVQETRDWWSIADVPMRDPRRFNRVETDALLEECTTLEQLVEAANSLAHDETTSYAGNGQR
jgi:proteasome accessory factor A